MKDILPRKIFPMKSSIFYIYTIFTLFLCVNIVFSDTPVPVSRVGSSTNQFCRMPMKDSVGVIDYKLLSMLTEKLLNGTITTSSESNNACYFTGPLSIYNIVLTNNLTWFQHISNVLRFIPTYACHMRDKSIFSESYTTFITQKQADMILECSREVSKIEPITFHTVNS